MTVVAVPIASMGSHSGSGYRAHSGTSATSY
jgi:hypothetical protein